MRLLSIEVFNPLTRVISSGILAIALAVPMTSYGVESFDEFLKRTEKTVFLDCSRVSPRPKYKFQGYYSPDSYVDEGMWGHIRLEFQDYQGKKTQNFDWELGSFDSSYVKQATNEYDSIRPKIRRGSDLLITKETSSTITLQTPPDETGRVDIFQLDKKTGKLNIYVWKKVATETRPNEKFQFRTEVLKKELKLSSTTEFKCQ